MSQCSQNEKQNERKVGCQGEVLWSWPYLQRSSRSWHTGGFLRQENARAAERPARSQQLLQEMLIRPGCCQSNGGHPYTYKSGVGEWGVLVTRSRSEQANRAWHVRQGVVRQFARQSMWNGVQEGHCHPTSSRGEFNWWSLPSQKKLSYSIHLTESYVL